MSEPSLAPILAPVPPSAVPELGAGALHLVPAVPPAQAPGHLAGAAQAPGRPVARLEIPPYDLTAALALQHELGVSHAMSQILVRRGFSEAGAARAFLGAAQAHEPARFSGIERAVDLVQRHLRAGSPITVHGDYDVDGVCATAIMVRALRALGANVGYFLPGRIEDGYGLALATVQRLAARGTKLLITVDCGITAVDEIAAARAAGIDVVCSDHHATRPDGILPACPIVHPAVCGYPCPELCGTGVAFKLAQALGADSAAQDIELVALATVADLVALRGENRRLVREGLTALANTAKPGLRALMAVAHADPSALDAQALAFRLAPRINAAGRLRRPDAGLELLLTGDEHRAGEIAAELDAVNAERRSVERRIAWEAQDQAQRLGERDAFVLVGEDWHPGVIGIVASRVVESHHRPAILIAMDADRGTGSGRSVPGFDLLRALHACAGDLERYGGHRAAAGLTVRRDRIDALREAFERHAAQALTPELREPVERVDAIVSGPELGLALAEELATLEPCGIGNPSPRLLVPGARFGDLRPMGGGAHARFLVSSGGVRAPAVAFGCDGRPAGGTVDSLDATFRLERNIWKGAVAPRLVLRHAQRCSPAPIEVLGEPEDYLAAVFSELDLAAVLQLDARSEGSLPSGTLLPSGAPLPRAGRLPSGEPLPSGEAVPSAGARRVVLDRRAQGPLAVLADALAAGGPVLAICADVPRRLGGLSTRTGGFALASYFALASSPSLAGRFPALVALDPPGNGDAHELLRMGSGCTYLAWGEPELRFAQQMHELEYGLRASLISLYRGLKHNGRAAGEDLERLLAGDDPHARSARLAGRLIRVLTELELVSLDRELPALALADSGPAELERSPSYRAYAQRLQDGRRYLSSPHLPRRPSA